MLIQLDGLQESDQSTIRRVTDMQSAERKLKLHQLLGEPELLSQEQAEKLHQFLGEHHASFSLAPGERGETAILQMEIDTGDA